MPPQTRQVQKKVIKIRGRRGWGGPWRAFVRFESLGTKGTPDLKALGKAYRTALQHGAESLRLCERVGEAAREAGARCPPRAGDSAFGPTGRNVRRQQDSNARRTLRAIMGEDKEAGALALGDHLANTSTSLEASLSAARSALRAHTKREAGRMRKIADTLTEFQAGAGHEGLKRLQSHLPGVALDGVRPVPAPGLACFEFALAEEPLVTKAAAWAHATKEANCTMALRQMWQALHKPIGETSGASAPPVQEPASECRKAGVCLCSPQGVQLKALRAAFIKAIKTAFPHISTMRQDLVQGHVVAKLVGSPLDDDFDAFLAEDDPIKELYLHVGKVRLSPFSLVMMRLSKTAIGNAPVGGAGAILVEVFVVQYTNARSRSASGFAWDWGPDQNIPVPPAHRSVDRNARFVRTRRQPVDPSKAGLHIPEHLYMPKGHGRIPFGLPGA